MLDRSNELIWSSFRLSFFALGAGVCTSITSRRQLSQSLRTVLYVCADPNWLPTPRRDEKRSIQLSFGEMESSANIILKEPLCRCVGCTWYQINSRFFFLLNFSFLKRYFANGQQTSIETSTIFLLILLQGITRSHMSCWNPLWSSRRNVSSIHIAKIENNPTFFLVESNWRL